MANEAAKRDGGDANRDPDGAAVGGQSGNLDSTAEKPDDLVGKRRAFLDRGPILPGSRVRVGGR